MKGNIDILITTETKLDMSFPINQFHMEGYFPPYRADRFMSQLIPSLDFYINKYDNFLMLGDFNSEMSEYAMEEFCEIYMTN